MMWSCAEGYCTYTSSYDLYVGDVQELQLHLHRRRLLVSDHIAGLGWKRMVQFKGFEKLLHIHKEIFVCSL